MTPERIEEVRKILSGMNQSSQLFPITVGDLNSLLAALEEVEQQKLKYKTEAERLNEICKQLAGEEMLFQDGGYETEMQRLWNKLEEAQQTIARKQLYIEKLELSRENAQQAADDIAREKGLELFEARQTIARQREALKFYADKKTWNKPGVDQSGMALAALGEGAKES